MKIILHAGLTLRHGQKTYEIVRQLDDDTYQLEECVTRRCTEVDRLRLLKQIYSKHYQIVLPTSASASAPEPADIKGLTDISSLKKSVQNGIERRREYVNALQKAHVTRGQRTRIEKIVKKVAERREDPRPPSASTVMTWARNYQKSGHSPFALMNGNATRRRHRRTNEIMDQLVSEKIRTVYLTKAKHTLQHTLDQICAGATKLVERKKLDAADATISLATLTRRVHEVDYFRRIAAREGVPRARMLCRTVMGGAGASYPLERVEVDHTPLNWVVVCDRTGLPLGRPLLTVMIDAYSGYVVGFYLSFYGPGLSSVSGVLRNAVMPKDDFVRGVRLNHRWLAHGQPDELILDNGLEFHARAFKLMSWELACDLTYCRVRTPWLKPHVERFFATLNHLTLARGRIHKRVASVVNLDPKKDAAIKFSDLVKGLIMFVADVHPFEINERKLARPHDLYLEGQELCPPVAYPGDMDSLKLVTAMSKTLTVGPGGVELHGLPFGGAELLPLRKRYGQSFKTLIKWDPDDLSSVYVQDPKSLEWTQSPCRWEEHAEGLSWNQHLMIRNFARKELKLKGAEEDLRAARLRLHDHWLDATSHKTNADAALAAKYSGVTSARVMSPGTEPLRPLKPVQPMANEEVEPMTVAEAPAFEAFEMD